MPKGFPKKKKKAAKKKATKRQYTRRTVQVPVEIEPVVMQQPNASAKKSIKQEIIEHLNAYHVKYTDMDGHFAIDSSQMMSSVVMTDMVDIGVQAINARMSANGTPYIAVYY